MEDLTPIVAEYITADPPSAQKYAIKYLGEVGGTEYCKKIWTVQMKGGHDRVVSAADTTLKKFFTGLIISVDATTGETASQDTETVGEDADDITEQTPAEFDDLEWVTE